MLQGLAAASDGEERGVDEGVELVASKIIDLQDDEVDGEVLEEGGESLGWRHTASGRAPQPYAAAGVEVSGEGEKEGEGSGGYLHVRLSRKDKGIAPGQFAGGTRSPYPTLFHLSCVH